jgi:hypothetical protein
VEAEHVRESALCGSCHTVITHPRGGRSEFVEQAPFLEWLASDYPAKGATCQRCHMPELEQGQYIAHRPPGGPFPPTSPRQPFGLHYFTGGNMMIPQLLAESDSARREEYLAAAGRARGQLRRAMQLSVEARRDGRWIAVNVNAANLAGHKLPTAYPSRRIWLHLKATAADGSVLFESGAWNAGSGEMSGGEKPQPLHGVIERSDQVQVFEAEYVDLQGMATVSLLQAAGYAKDTRILPVGFRPERLRNAGLGQYQVGAAGLAAGAVFIPGSAMTRYRFRGVEQQGSIQVEVEALYQGLKPDHRVQGFPYPLRQGGVVRIAEATLEVR